MGLRCQLLNLDVGKDSINMLKHKIKGDYWSTVSQARQVTDDKKLTHQIALFFTHKVHCNHILQSKPQCQPY